MGGTSIGHGKNSLMARVGLLALGLNLAAWAGAVLLPGAKNIWGMASLALFFALGAAVGRWWAVLVTIAFGIIHAIPVYLGLLPGYLSTWEEALWWVFALGILLAVTALGVLTRLCARGLRSRRGP